MDGVSRQPAQNARGGPTTALGTDVPALSRARHSRFVEKSCRACQRKREEGKSSQLVLSVCFEPARRRNVLIRRLDWVGFESMPDLDIAWLVKELDGLGLKFTATPRIDGSMQLNRWRAMNYWENAPLADALWAEHVGDDTEVIRAITEFVARPNLEILGVPSIAPKQRSTTR